MSSPDPSSQDIFQPGGPLRQELLSEAAAAALREAIRFARETCWESVRSPHVFMGLLAAPDPCLANWGERLRVDLHRLCGQFVQYFQQEQPAPEGALALHREFLSDNVIRLLRASRDRAGRQGRTSVTPMDLLIILLTAPGSIVAQCCEQLSGVTAAKLTEQAVMAEQHAGRD
jgi:ATP-dependent Clp protease ATP-binding subunit ClpA